MTDYTDLIAWLRTSNNIRDHEAATELEAQARRIAELEKQENDMMHSEYRTARARIAELEVPLCIGRRTIGIMAEEGMWQSEDGRAVVAADELFRQDPYARIAELEAALKPFADIAKELDADSLRYCDIDITVAVGDLRAARAALENKND
jgi:hypothetical protein